jgi:glutamate racemase
MKIGVFDSGVGGLTVLKALREELPSVDFFYLGDTARVPYGGKSKETIQRYSLECAEFPLSFGIGLLVVALQHRQCIRPGASKGGFNHTSGWRGPARR